MIQHVIIIVFLFAIGASVGSFLNVVVYRVPREMSLIWPGSHCPQCNTPLAWYDNIPVLGWILLRGKCRYCGKPISPRYPIVEAFTGLLFVFYYVMFFFAHAGPCIDVFDASAQTGSWFLGQFTNLQTDWPIFALYMALISGLLAATLTDIALFIIPAGIPWILAAAGLVVHGFWDTPGRPGSLLAPPWAMALTAGAALGLVLAIVLLEFGVIPLSFPEGDLLEIERHELKKKAKAAREQDLAHPPIPPELTGAQVRGEIRKEMVFLILPMTLAVVSTLLYMHVSAIHRWWETLGSLNWLSAVLGSLLGGMIGAMIVWFFRIAGSYVAGQEAMGLGDVHLMFGVGAVMGPGVAIVAFFISPFFGIALALYMWIAHGRRQLPFGPYLSLATAFLMLFYSPIAAHLWPEAMVMISIIRNLTGLN